MKIKPWQPGIVWNTEGVPGDGTLGSPPADVTTGGLNDQPDANPGRDETTDFVLDAFNAMERDYDDVDEIEQVETPAATPSSDDTVVATTAGTAPAAPGQAQPPAAAQPAGQTTPPAGSEGQQPGTGSPSAQQQPQAAGSPEQILSNLAAQIEQNRQAFTDALAQQAYAISEQELDEFQTDPGKVIAKVAARVQVQTTESLMRVLHQQLPVYVNGLVQAQAKNADAENQFWNANPGLNRSQHADVVRSIGAWYRQQNPRATAEEFSAVVGRMAMAQLGLAHNAIQQAAPGISPPTVQTPGRVVRNVVPPPAFGMHNAPPSAQPAPPRSEWDVITQMMETYE